jgi:hypothetical protein
MVRRHRQSASDPWISSHMARLKYPLYAREQSRPGQRSRASQADDARLRSPGHTWTSNVRSDSRRIGEQEGSARDRGSGVTLKQWLAYAEKRVPILQEAMANKTLQELLDQESSSGRRGPVVWDPTGVRRYQKPALFDFARSRRDILLSK